MNESGRARAWVLAFVLLAGGGIGTLIGVGCGIRANYCPFTKHAKQTSTDGRQLFAANCALCHGASGQGGTGPWLTAGDALTLSDTELVSKIARGKPLAGMPAFKRELSSEQIGIVARYVVSLRGSS